MISVLIVIILSYLIGSIPTSLIAGKVLRGIDIRKHGSGNAGATNVFRVLGWKAGVFILVFDGFKGFAATYWISQISFGSNPWSPEIMQIIAGCSTIFGHIWTIFAHFRGGKGVGTAAGMLIALYPLAFLICIVVFIVLVFITRIVSIGSISAALTLPIVLAIFKYVLDKNVPDSLFIFSFFAAALIIFTHRGNIKRLINGTENRFGSRPKAVNNE
jgi:glycerol-3-phosphate acyltransferase PlsY